MYGKIFDSMYEGTLYGHWEAIVTLQQMLVLCTSDGVIDMTPHAIAARTSIPLEIITKGIGVLEEPDPYTRTPGEDGKRIVLLDAHRPWGWRIVNHAKYQKLKNREQKLAADRERVSEKRKSQKINDVADRRGSSRSVAYVAHAYADATTATDALSVSSAKASETGAAAPKAPDPVKDEIWRSGREILKAQGESKDSAGSFLGKLCKDYGNLLVLEAVRDCVKVTPAEAKGWLVARCQERRGSGSKQSALEARNKAVADAWVPPEMREPGHAH